MLYGSQTLDTRKEDMAQLALWLIRPCLKEKTCEVGEIGKSTL